MTDPITALLVLIAGLVVTFYLAAIAVRAWLVFLAWRWQREIPRLEAATARLQAVGSGENIDDDLDLALDALRRSERARARYERACHRFGAEPWRTR